MISITLVSEIISILLSIPLLVTGIELMTAVFSDQGNGSSDEPSTYPNQTSYKILIPAHNEAGIIQQTLSRLIAEIPEKNPAQIVLIADNCSDNTAEISRSLGVTVLERFDTTHRGKGYALDFGIRYLAASGQPLEIVVILDADCETDRLSLLKLLSTVSEKKLPAQMVYLMKTPEQASLKQKIAGFAWLVKNQIRLLGVNKLGFPVVLTGTGMAFPLRVLETIELAHGNIVEDMQLGIDCTLAGFPPVLCPSALVYSYFPEQTSAELSQRTRWEHGHLQTILQQTPKLMLAAFKQHNGPALALALDIGVPPLSLLILTTLAGLIFCATITAITGSVTSSVILTVSFLYFTVMLGMAWNRYGRSYLSPREIAGIPYYILSKLSIYFGFFFKRQKEWVRTGRDL